MASGNSFKFILYLLFAILVGGGVLLLDQALQLHHTSEASHSSKPKKYHNVDNPEAQENIEGQSSYRTDREPMFKQQILLNPNFKGAVNTDSLLAAMAERTDKKQAVPEEIPEFVPIQELRARSMSVEKYFENLKLSYQERIMKPLVKGDIRRDIIIRYYTHKPDGDRVYHLRNLGFYIHERPVEKEQLEIYESNSVFYGDEVTKEDLQMVVFTLLERGVPIRQVTKSKFHDGWKSGSIEIGTDTSITSEPVLSLEQVRTLKP